MSQPQMYIYAYKKLTTSKYGLLHSQDFAKIRKTKSLTFRLQGTLRFVLTTQRRGSVFKYARWNRSCHAPLVRQRIVGQVARCVVPRRHWCLLLSVPRPSDTDGNRKTSVDATHTRGELRVPVPCFIVCRDTTFCIANFPKAAHLSLCSHSRLSPESTLSIHVSYLVWFMVFKTFFKTCTFISS